MYTTVELQVGVTTNSNTKSGGLGDTETEILVLISAFVLKGKLFFDKVWSGKATIVFLVPYRC